MPLGFPWAFVCRASCRRISALLAGLLILFACFSAVAASPAPQNPDYLFDNWSAGEGIPENSALTVAQTPDGYLWVGSTGGLLRFNASEFQRASRLSGVRQLDTPAHWLHVDQQGRLWVSTSSGLVVKEGTTWRVIPGPSIRARSIAVAPSGEVFIGGLEGQVYQVVDRTLLTVTNHPSLAASGVFVIRDLRADALWLANRSFIGKHSAQGWIPIGDRQLHQGALLAAPSRNGGIWVYCGGRLSRHRLDGTVEDWAMPSVDQPRELTEDSSGALWVSSMSTGLVRYRPGGEVTVINATNGLTHGSARCTFEDVEGNLWVGTSSSGLFRLKSRRVASPGADNGLADRIVKTITEVAPGVMLAGTHGGGVALIENDRATWKPISESGSGAYTWSVLRDRSGRIWTGSYNSGLLVTEEGVDRRFPLPPQLGTSVGALLEDSQGRLWVGGSLGLGLIEAGTARVWPHPPQFGKVNVRSIVEDSREGVLWVGTFGTGLWQVDLKNPGKATHVEGLPRRRITSLALDREGYLWAGVFGEGLYCLRGGTVSPVGRDHGLPAHTVGSIIEDGRGYIWMGTDQGIVRVSAEDLRRAADGRLKELSFNLFNSSDGMEINECSEGFQPTAALDSAGRLWFATLRGVVRIDPTTFRVNARPPPVVIEQVSYTDRQGTNHLVLAPSGAELALPAGCTGLEFRYAALSYSAPEKTAYVYHLAGLGAKEVAAGGDRSASFQVLPPGEYTFQVKAANNDGVWNSTGAVLKLHVHPFLWQTAWFKGLLLLGLSAGIGVGGWRVARARYRVQIERLEQQHALARERARLSAVMEATTDLVAFADHDGRILHLNPAGRRMLGLDGSQPNQSLKLSDLFAPSAAEMLLKEGIPAAEKTGAWQAESAVRRADSTEIPVSQVVMAHKDAEGRLGFISTIVRDISEQKRAAAEREKLQDELAQAQKLESVGRLAGGVAHDFNNALQVILGHVELALEDATPGTPLEEDLLEIRRSAKRSADLTSQLLAFARRQMVTPQVMDLNATIAQRLPDLKQAAGNNLEIAWQPGSPIWSVKLDPAQLEQLLRTLVANAREAIEGQGLLTIQTANVTVSHPAPSLPPDCRPGDYVLLTLRDNGRGMAAPVVQHLFEPFFTTKEIGQGSGLGLATVFGIVKQNAGSIVVDSQPGQGTSFRIYLPRAQAGAQAG